MPDAAQVVPVEEAAFFFRHHRVFEDFVHRAGSPLVVEDDVLSQQFALLVVQAHAYFVQYRTEDERAVAFRQLVLPADAEVLLQRYEVLAAATFEFAAHGGPVFGKLIARVRQRLGQQVNVLPQFLHAALRAEVDGEHLFEQAGKALFPAFHIKRAEARAVAELIERQQQRTALAKQFRRLEPVVVVGAAVAAFGHHHIQAAFGVEKLMQGLVLVLPGEVPDIELEGTAPGHRKLILPNDDVHPLRAVGLGGQVLA